MVQNLEFCIFNGIIILQFYVMDIYRNGQPMPESELLYQLVKIRDSTQTREFPVGILTSDGRTQWANARQRLIKGMLMREKKTYLRLKDLRYGNLGLSVVELIILNHS